MHTEAPTTTVPIPQPSQMPDSLQGPQPYAEKAPTPEEAMAEIIAQHEEQMQALVDSHHTETRMLNIEYGAQLEEATPQSAAITFGDMENNVHGQLALTSRSVVSQIRRTSKTLMSMLPEEDSRLLHGEIAEAIRQFGLGSKEVKDIVADSPNARALDVILDSSVISNLQATIDKFGLYSQEVGEAVQLGSSRPVRAGLVAALDARVATDVEDKVRHYGFGHRNVVRATNMASTATIRQAIANSLNARALSMAVSPELHSKTIALSDIPNPKVRSLIYGVVHNEAWPIADPIIEMAVATAAVDHPEQEKYLRAINPAFIRQAMGIVGELRAMDGSIRDVAIITRLGTDAASEGVYGSTRTSRAMERSKSILIALMGGRPRGKLPF